LDGNGILDYQEVSAALVILCKGSVESKIKFGLEAFSELDKPGHVVITMKNFKRFLLCIFKLSLEHKQEVLLDYDLDKLSDQVAVKCFEFNGIEDTKKGQIDHKQVLKFFG